MHRPSSYSSLVHPTHMFLLSSKSMIRFYRRLDRALSLIYSGVVTAGSRQLPSNAHSLYIYKTDLQQPRCCVYYVRPKRVEISHTKYMFIFVGLFFLLIKSAYGHLSRHMKHINNIKHVVARATACSCSSDPVAAGKDGDSPSS